MIDLVYVDVLHRNTIEQKIYAARKHREIGYAFMRQGLPGAG